MSSVPTMAATALLRQQHDTVKQMFDQLLNADAPQRTELFDCLRATLAATRPQRRSWSTRACGNSATTATGSRMPASRRRMKPRTSSRTREARTRG